MRALLIPSEYKYQDLAIQGLGPVYPGSFFASPWFRPWTVGLRVMFILPQLERNRVCQEIAMRMPHSFLQSKPAILLLNIPVWTGTMLYVQIAAHLFFGRHLSWPLTFGWGSVMAAAYTWRPRMRWNR